MDASEGAEGFRIPGLDSETDASHSALPEELGFFGSQGCGVGFKGPFLELGKVDALCDFGEEELQLLDAERGGRSTAEVEGFWPEGVGGAGVVHFRDERVEEGVIFVF